MKKIVIISKIKPIEPQDLINRYCDILGVEQQYKEYAINVAKVTDYLEFVVKIIKINSLLVQFI